MEYHVRLYDPGLGRVTERLVDADSEEGARRQVEQDGLTAVSMHAVRRQPVLRPAPFRLALFCEELRTLLGSGMSLVEATETLCLKSAGEARQILQDLQLRLLEGKPLSGALALNRFAFPPLLIASIRASERSSRIEDALNEYIVYDNVSRDIRKKLVSAAIYPALVVGFSVVVCLFMLIYVVPRFAQVYDDFGQALSLPTAVLITAGRFARDYLWLLLAGLAAAIALAVWWYRSGALQSLLLRVISRWSVTRYYLRLFQLTQIYQTMAMLLRGGYSLSDAIPLARNLAFGDEMRAHMDAAAQAVAEGKRLSAAFASHGLTDQVSERLLQVGERSGNLAKIMDIIAHGHRQEFALFIERASRLVEPLLLMGMGLLIGAIIILMYMPVFELAGGI